MSEHRIVDPDLLRAMREADLDARKGLDAHWDWWLQANIPAMVQRALDHRHLLLSHVERLEQEIEVLREELEILRSEAKQRGWKDDPDELGWWVCIILEEFDMGKIEQPVVLRKIVSEQELKWGFRSGVRWLRIPKPTIPKGE